MDPQSPRVVATFSDPIEANLAVGLLESEGIPARLADEATVTTAWHMAVTFGGIKVLVAGDHFEAASQILASAKAKPSESAARAQDALDEESEPANNQREDAANRAAKAALLGLLFPPLELYALWLVLGIVASRESLQPTFRNRAWFAGILSASVVLAVWFLFLKPLFAAPPLDYQ